MSARVHVSSFACQLAMRLRIVYPSLSQQKGSTLGVDPWLAEILDVTDWSHALSTEQLFSYYLALHRVHSIIK